MKTKCQPWRGIVNNEASQFINKLALLLDGVVDDGQMRFAKATNIVSGALSTSHDDQLSSVDLEQWLAN